MLLMMLPALLFAEPVGLLQAQRQAEAVMGKHMTRMPNTVTRSTADLQLPYYIFMAEDGMGFCIVAANDTLPAILGYSRENKVTSAEAMPDGLKLYLKHISLLESNKMDALDIQVSPVVEPLCPSSWGQDKPYNNLCPLKDGQACPTGCVATAMAQIMYRWQWPEQGIGYSWAKDGVGETYHGSLEHVYDWASMCATTAENIVSEAASEAVSTLLYDCGLSVNMNYKTDGSGAVSPIKAFYTNFGFIPTTLRVHHRDCYTADEWLALIKNELSNGRPIYYSAFETSAGGDLSGHAFIVDGYDETDYVHVNWGWDGTWNGYFPLARLNPGGHLYKVGQRMTLGIEPARNGETGTPIEYPFISSPLKCSIGTSMRKSQAFTVSVFDISNPNANSHTWQLSMGIFDTKGQMLGEIKSGPVPSVTLSSGYITSSGTTINCKLKDSTPNGDYALRLLFRESGDTEWLQPDIYGGFTKSAIYIRINGTKVDITDGTDYIRTAVRDVRNDSPFTINYYDLQGRPAVNPRQGIYVRNGRTVLFQ